jgi:hypothetical protein
MVISTRQEDSSVGTFTLPNDLVGDPHLPAQSSELPLILRKELAVLVGLLSCQALKLFATLLQLKPSLRSFR